MLEARSLCVQEAGSLVMCGDLEIYRVGEGHKCVIWCHDFSGCAGKEGNFPTYLTDILVVSSLREGGGGGGAQICYLV